ncbi:MAG TPA: glycosyltransferase family 1 protein [Blastocatellia bacterium]|nr:glycosyltransferase family 1 protein [Blastocatellia bacterium]
MKVLFLHENRPDYLAESLFHGLRTILGQDCVDVPRFDSMYAPLTPRIKSKVRGQGFTLYGLLDDIPQLAEERFFWRKDLASYDLIVIAHIWEQWATVWDLSRVVRTEQMVLLDGYDTTAFFPYWPTGLRRNPWSYFAPISRYKYFKRELVGEGHSLALDRFLPRALRRWIPLPRNAMPISFSIPREKISRNDAGPRTRDFPTHIVDEEVAAEVRGVFFSSTGSDSHFFYKEDDYYADLKSSRFGVTLKRAGWDCLRHYELAASGCVLCFRDLDKKPATCAPHGLNESNCIIYHDYKELKDRISALTTHDYAALQKKTYEWIESNTTVTRASQFLIDCQKSSAAIDFQSAEQA